MFTIDAHLDLATNAITLNRDPTLPAQAIREEKSPGAGKTLRTEAMAPSPHLELRKGWDRSRSRHHHIAVFTTGD